MRRENTNYDHEGLATFDSIPSWESDSILSDSDPEDESELLKIDTEFDRLGKAEGRRSKAEGRRPKAGKKRSASRTTSDFSDQIKIDMKGGETGTQYERADRGSGMTAESKRMWLIFGIFLAVCVLGISSCCIS